MVLGKFQSKYFLFLQSKKMKLLFVARNPSLLFQYERVISRIIEKGHTVEFHLDSLEWRNGRMDATALQKYQEQSGGLFIFSPAKRPTGFLAGFLKNTREILSYAAYIRESNPISTSPYMIERQCQALYSPFNILLRNRLLKALVLKKNRLRWLSLAEKYINPSKDVTQVIQKSNPDIVVATPFIFAHSIVEPEYVKCAAALNIPSCVLVFSWDNLTSKGVFQIFPDRILVWNQMQQEELRIIHGVSSDRVAITGAPSLDFWFEQKPRMSRVDFCRNHGMEENRPFIVYLCSSQTIAKDEHFVVRDFVNELKKCLGDDCPTILIRPHPLNIHIWDDWVEEGTVIVPKSNRDIFYSKSAKELFFETFYYSACVVGLNTTAMVEAAIVDKPCISILCDRYKDTQERSGHFHHLADSGFVFVTRQYGEAVDFIVQVLRGEDSQIEARKRFVKSFIRPNGINVQSSEVMVEYLLRMASEGQSNVV